RTPAHPALVGPAIEAQHELVGDRESEHARNSYAAIRKVADRARPVRSVAHVVNRRRGVALNPKSLSSLAGHSAVQLPINRPLPRHSQGQPTRKDKLRTVAG